MIDARGGVGLREAVKAQDTHNSKISWSYASHLSWFGLFRKSGCPVPSLRAVSPCRLSVPSLRAVS